MSPHAPTHHVTEPVMAAYVAGQLPHAYAMVVASHIELCDSCRAMMEAHAILGGTLIEDGPQTAVTTSLKSDLMAQLDSTEPFPKAPTTSSAFPSPVMRALKGQPPRWRPLGGGIRQSVLYRRPEGTVRLLYIPGGTAVPEHGHGGLELTLVLQGAFEDETGIYNAGDLEISDGTLEHQPIALPGPACICLAATDEPLSFKTLLPRLLQPLLRI